MVKHRVTLRNPTTSYRFIGVVKAPTKAQAGIVAKRDWNMEHWTLEQVVVLNHA